MSLTTRKMSDAHEVYLAALLQGRMTKGSGNQWHNPMDGRHSARSQYWAFAWDGKSTLSKTVSIGLEMWRKAREQASPEMPMLPLRFYSNESLEVALDLVVVHAEHFADMQVDANRYRAAKDNGCFVGSHTTSPESLSTCVICETDLFDAR